MARSVRPPHIARMRLDNVMPKPRKSPQAISIDAEAANKIRETRNARGLSQEEVAARIEVDRSTYVRYESGEIPVTLPKLRSIARVLDSTVAELIGENSALDRIPVQGRIAREWATESSYPAEQAWQLPMPRSRVWPRRFGLDVADASCDRYAAAGAVLLCVSLAEAGPLSVGDRVIVDLREANRSMRLCMIAGLLADGSITLVNETRDRSLRLEVRIEPRRAASRGLSEALGPHPEEGAPIAYDPDSNAPVIIVARVVGTQA